MDKVIVIKIGGTTIDDPKELDRFLKSFAPIKGPKILVHGGGTIASTIGEKLGVVPNMVDGRRVTDRETLDVVTMVYAGLLNKNIVAQLSALEVMAMGMSGADVNMIRVNRRPAEPIDYGYVGDIVEVNKTGLLKFLQMGIVPVFSAITHDNQGQLYNTNADTIASQLAVAISLMADVDLYFCFDRPGVLSDPEDMKSVLPEITAQEFPGLREKGIVSGGMLPKLEGAFESIRSGVGTVTLCHYGALAKLGSKQFVGTTLRG